MRRDVVAGGNCSLGNWAAESLCLVSVGGQWLDRVRGVKSWCLCLGGCMSGALGVVEGCVCLHEGCGLWC